MLKIITKSPFKKSNFTSNKVATKTTMMKKKYRRFNITLLMASLMPILAVGTFNFLVDPYGIFKNRVWIGLNQTKPQKVDNDRLFKATDIIHIKPRTILLGSSRVRQGLDPNYPLLSQYKPVYNLGLNGVNIHEQLAYLKHAIANNPNLKVVIAEIDLFMFNQLLPEQSAFDPNRLEKQYLTWKDIINASFSWNALLASKETVIASFNGRNKPQDANYGQNGFMPYRNINKTFTLWRFQFSINQYLDNHLHYQLSKADLEDFKKLVELCRKHNIALKIFISPAHATQGEVIRLTGYWDTWEQWKREIVKITPVWDFSGYNSVTTEKISNETRNYADNSHYMPHIGRLILNRLFSHQEETVPQDFGVFLTTENVEEYLQKTRDNRQVWLKENPDAEELVKTLIQKYDANSKTNK